jgi:hypothetical protein
VGISVDGTVKLRSVRLNFHLSPFTQNPKPNTQNPTSNLALGMEARCRAPRTARRRRVINRFEFKKTFRRRNAKKKTRHEDGFILI